MGFLARGAKQSHRASTNSVLHPFVETALYAEVEILWDHKALLNFRAAVALSRDDVWEDAYDIIVLDTFIIGLYMHETPHAVST